MPSPPSRSRISLFDSVSRTVRPLSVDQGGSIDFYACGVTPYSASHIGHARSFVVFDTMARVWRAQGYAVRLVRNRTDIDDKIIAAAAAAGTDWKTWSERWATAHQEDMARLGVASVEEPRVSAHIPDIRALIVRLIDRGQAYATAQGNVYFKTASFRGTDVAHQNARALRTAQGQGRVDHEDKHDGADFALWKSAAPGEPSWPSPWGAGRPGWHVECSAMIEALFGRTLTIHGGGVDLRFPHHQCEICQSEAAFDRPLAEHWIHHGSVLHRGQKMSKSLGNVVSVDEALAQAEIAAPGAGAAVLRWALLRTHWHRPLDWTDDLLPSAAAELASWHRALADAPPQPDAGVPEMASAWEDALNNNFNVPKASSVLHQAARVGNRSLIARAFHDMGLTADLWPQAWEPGSLPPRPVPEDVRELARQRDEARELLDWPRADALRVRLADSGWRVVDGADGFTLEPLPIQSIGSTSAAGHRPR